MLQKFVARPGLNREGTNLSNEGGYYDGDKIRFRSGFPEKLGGWTQVSPLAYDGTCRSIWTWADGDQGTGAQYIGLGTSSKYYIYYGGIYNDITPIAQTNKLTNPFSVTVGSNTVIVYDNNYEPVIGDSVNFSGATPVGGITIDGEYKITSIPATNSSLSPNTYTIKSEVSASSNATSGGGTVTAGYEYPIGSTVYTVGTGWGAGPWGGVIFPTTKLLGANPFAAVSGSNILTITLANHGVTDQTYVAFQDATGFANIPGSTLNTTYLATVSDANTFTVPMPSGFTSDETASGGGNSVRMTIQTGGQGWGESYSSGIGQQLRLWSNDNYGADLVIAPRGGPVFYWSDLSDVNTRAQYLSNLANAAPSIFDNTVFSFGATAITITTAGSGYKDNTYTNVQLVKETGDNAGPDMLTYPTANITVSGGAVTDITVVNGGTGAQEAGTVLTIAPSAIGGGSVTALGNLVAGTGYTSGTYTNVPLLYVSGPEMTIYPLANVTVTNGNVSAVTISTEEDGGGLGATEVGTVLSTPSVFLGGGGAVATLGTITGGSEYEDGTYSNVQLIKADTTSPSMLVYPTANITVVDGAVTAVELVTRGLGANSIGTLLTASSADIGGGGGFQVPVATLGTNGSGFEIMVTAIAGSGFTSTVTEIGGTDNILVSGANAPYVYPYMYITGANIPEDTFVESINNATGVATISQRPTASSSGTYSYSFGGAYVPSQTYQVITSAIQEFIICFGANPYVPGVKSGEGISTFDPLLVRWSDQGNAYQWIPQVTNQSGEYLLTNGSFIMGARYTRQEILVWTDSCLYSMQYLGAPYVWGFQVLMNNITVISPNCMVTVNNVTYWMGRDRFYMYTGRVEVLPCSLRQYIFGDINQSQAYQIFAGTNEAYNEVWWYYVSESGGGTEIDKYVIYNYLDRVWYYGSLNRTAWLESGTLPYPIAATFYTTAVFTASIEGTTMTVSSVDFGSLAVGQLVKGDGVEPGTVIESGPSTGNVGTYTVNNSQKVDQESMTSTDGRGILVNHEDGNDDLSTALTLPIYSYVQSSDFDIGDGNNFGFVWRILPDVNFNGSTVNNPSVTMTVKPRENSGTMYTKADMPVVTSRQDYTRIPQYTIQEFTGQVYTRIRGRQMAFRIESFDVGVAWQLGAIRIDVKPDARR